MGGGEEHMIPRFKTRPSECRLYAPNFLYFLVYFCLGPHPPSSAQGILLALSSGKEVNYSPFKWNRFIHMKTLWTSKLSSLGKETQILAWIELPMEVRHSYYNPGNSYVLLPIFVQRRLLSKAHRCVIHIYHALWCLLWMVTEAQNIKSWLNLQKLSVFFFLIMFAYPYF